MLYQYSNMEKWGDKVERNICFGCMVDNPQGGICPECGFNPEEYTAEEHHLVPGTVLHERYAVGRVLGEGGFGITYVGFDTLLDLKVAVKEFYMSDYVNREATVSSVVRANTRNCGETFAKNRAKFLGEAKALAKFANEDGIVGIRDFFQENNTAYIVMDFLSGETLKKHIAREGKLSVDRVLTILDPVIRSLGVVHRHNVIHRDISPDNIMLTDNGKVKLLDFGAARVVSENDIKSLSIILKPGYAPEEQYRSRGHQGPWTDVYALCATVYRCVTGVTPDDSMERMFEDRLQSPAELGCDCSRAMSDVIMKGLAVRLADRYQSVEELLAGIENAKANPNFVAPVAKPIPDADRTLFVGDETEAEKPEQAAKPPEEHTVKAEVEPADGDRTVIAVMPRQTDADSKLPHGKTAPKRSRRRRFWLIFGIIASSCVVATLAYVLPGSIDSEIKYNEAIALAEQGKYSDAMEIFAGIYGYGSSREKVMEYAPKVIENCSVGDSIYLGEYEQDNNTVNGEELIEWVVLARENGRVLVTSKYILDTVPYNTEEGLFKWRDSSLREWLNNSFKNDAFSLREQTMIAEVKNENHKNPTYGTDGGGDTSEKVFCLSIEEADKYFATSAYRQTSATAYAMRGTLRIGTSGSAGWWLRSPGYAADRAAYVREDGVVYEFGCANYVDTVGVRPAMWINIE